MTPEQLQGECVEVLQRLVRFNTVNPPGNERPAIEYLERYVAEAGFETEILGDGDDRPNLVADLRGEREGPDAVPARPRRHRARRARGVAARSVVRRRGGRLSLGPGRDWT